MQPTLVVRSPTSSRKGGDGRPTEQEHLHKRILRFTRCPLAALERKGDLAEAEGRDHAAHEPMTFAHRAEGANRACAEEAEVAYFRRHSLMDESPHYVITG